MGDFKYDETEGWSYESEHGKYHLFECTSLGGKTTSDIIVIMAEHGDSYEFVNFVYGAFLFENGRKDSITMKFIETFIETYEVEKEKKGE